MIKALSIISKDILERAFYQDIKDLKYLKKRWKSHEFSVEVKAVGIVVVMVGGVILAFYIADIYTVTKAPLWVKAICWSGKILINLPSIFI